MCCKITCFYCKSYINKEEARVLAFENDKNMYFCPMAQLEICTGSYESALAALRGGADRVELCSGLEEGGITPSLGLVRAICKLQGIRKHVLIRPRGGDFLYTPAEQEIMIDDIFAAREAGVDGVVIGGLTAAGDIDMAFCRKLMDAADSLSVTFHRAFDVCRDASLALEQIIDLGCTRLLTSGQAATAEAGIPVLCQLVQQAAGRITIMPGSGVGSQNAAIILQQTGATEIHASARSDFHSKMEYRHDGVGMGRKDADEYIWKETAEEVVRAIKQEIL